MKNPYVALLRTAWHYARQQRGRYLAVYFLFICANLVGAAHPFSSAGLSTAFSTIRLPC